MTSNVHLEVKLDRIKLHRFLNTPHSGDAADLWSDLEKRKLAALAGAKRMAGFRTGRLRKNISARHLGNATGQYVTIGADVPYALLHHEGTKPHVILPSNGRFLTFRKGAQVIFTEKVFHPGTKPNPYLRSQLIHFRH